MAALSRIARGEHNQVHDRARRHRRLLVEHGPGQRAGGERDRQPPGPGRRRATSPRRQNPRVHVSGHGSASDLLLMLPAAAPAATSRPSTASRATSARTPTWRGALGHRRRPHPRPRQRRRPRGRRAGAPRSSDRVHAGPDLRRPGRRRGRHRERAPRPPPPVGRRPGAGRRRAWTPPTASPVGEVEIVTRGFGSGTTRSSSRRPASRWSAASPPSAERARDRGRACSSTSCTTPSPRWCASAPSSARWSSPWWSRSRPSRGRCGRPGGRGRCARSSSSGESGPTPPKKTPTSIFQRFR